MKATIKNLESLHFNILKKFTTEYSKYYDCKLWYAKEKEQIVFKDMQHHKYLYLMLEDILELSFSKKYVKNIKNTCEKKVDLKHI